MHRPYPAPVKRLVLATSLMLSLEGGCSSRTPSGLEVEPTVERNTNMSNMSDATDQLTAIAEAEAFVRAQGYAETPPTASGGDIVREGIEGTLDDRRNSLDPKALRATGSAGHWDVIFKYRDPTYAGRGRLLRLRAGERPSFVHQDLLLDVALKPSP